MPNMNRVQKAASVHDKSKSTYREKSKKRHFTEKKEMEHEYRKLETEIKKMMADGYEVLTTEEIHDQYVVTFINRSNRKRKRINFVFGENYCKLKKQWDMNELNH